MKTVILLIVLTFLSIPAFAADFWQMKGVMAVYPGGPLNNPFSSPIADPTEYKFEEDCDAAITQLAQTLPIVSAINKGVALPPQPSIGGFVAVAAKCYKFTVKTEEPEQK